MSDSSKSFDDVFRTKLSEHSISPPEFVWENIQAKRSYGHVVANKISINWRTFGTMLLMLLGGGTSAILFGGEDAKEPSYEVRMSQPIKNKLNPLKAKHEFKQPTKKSEDAQNYQAYSQVEQKEAKINETKLNSTEELLPGLELLASMEQAAFSRPHIHSNPQLNILIEELDGWESAKPISFVRYYELEKAPQHGIFKRKIEREAFAEKMEYDYVKYEVTKKGFWERSSILFAFTPQSINKSMTAKYNLSSSYLKHRANSEHTRLAYTLEANLHYELKNHKFLESGINYTQIYEEMSFKGEKRFSNQYHFMEIPFLLGFEDRNSKWGYHIKGGLGLQLFNQYSGYIYRRYDKNQIPEPDGNSQYRMRTGNAVKSIVSGKHSLSDRQDPDEVINLSNEAENPFKKGGVVNIHLAAGLTYYHSIKTSFVFAPYFRRSVNSITKESALFNERISYTGISIGTRIKF